jgi:DnaJ-class molecular chaperone
VSQPQTVGPPYVHTYAPPVPTWVDCRDCQGSEGAMVNGEWEDCTGCRGEGGYLSYPQPGPALTITEGSDDGR